MSRSKARRLADLIKANLDRLTVNTATNAVNVLDETDTEVKVVEAGSGVVLDGKTVSLDIDGLTAESSIASTDLISVHDVSAGTVVKATIADAVANVTDSNALAAGDNVSELTNDSGYITGNQTITLTGDASGSGTTSINVTVANDSHTHDGRYYTESEADSRFVNVSGDTITGGLTVSGELQCNGRLDVGNSGGDDEIRIYKGDNNVSDHIQFYNGTTRVGEIGVQDTTWLRLNQVTAKNIYTPRYIRADGGFYVDATSRFTSDDVGFVRLTYDDAGDGGLRIYDSGNVRQGTLYGSGGGEFGLLDNDNHWFCRARTGTNNNYIYCNNNAELYIYTSYVLAPGSMRSPIFYDSDNTSYYMNPASTSKINSMLLEGTIQHNGDTNTYMQFHAADQWRVVTGGGERIEVNNTNTSVANTFRMNNGYGSVATAYGCRAWIKYNPRTNAINGSGNISSLTNYSASRDRINFSTAMPNTNYAAVTGSNGSPTTFNNGRFLCPYNFNTSNVEVTAQRANNSAETADIGCVAIFR